MFILTDDNRVLSSQTDCLTGAVVAIVLLREDFDKPLNIDSGVISRLAIRTPTMDADLMRALRIYQRPSSRVITIDKSVPLHELSSEELRQTIHNVLCIIERDELEASQALGQDNA